MEVGAIVRGAAQALGLDGSHDIAFSFWCAAVDEAIEASSAKIDIN